MGAPKTTPKPKLKKCAPSAFFQTWFERAIFLSWYCSKADCAFCYLSAKKKNIINPKLDRRTPESIFAEAIICKLCGWKVEFLSGGCESYATDELFFLIKNIHGITGQKQWLNIGVLKKEQLEKFKPHIEGVCGAVECINLDLRKKLCPSKPLDEITEMFKFCDELKLKKAMTIIIGLGETLNDFETLNEFIKKYGVDRVTFYALKPHKGTIFKKGPETDYYVEWIARTRAEFPKLPIIAGSWLNRLDEIHLLLNAGANAVTKFPSIRKFNSKYAKKIEEEAKLAGREFIGTLTKMPEFDINKEIKKLKLGDEMKEKIKVKFLDYTKNLYMYPSCI